MMLIFGNCLVLVLVLVISQAVSLIWTLLELLHHIHLPYHIQALQVIMRTGKKMKESQVLALALVQVKVLTTIPSPTVTTIQQRYGAGTGACAKTMHSPVLKALGIKTQEPEHHVPGASALRYPRTAL